MTAYASQFGQDEFLDCIVFRGLAGGFFVDVGAHDGEQFSNSLFFERGAIAADGGGRPSSPSPRRGSTLFSPSAASAKSISSASIPKAARSPCSRASTSRALWFTPLLSRTTIAPPPLADYLKQRGFVPLARLTVEDLYLNRRLPYFSLALLCKVRLLRAAGWVERRLRRLGISADRPARFPFKKPT